MEPKMNCHTCDNSDGKGGCFILDHKEEDGSESYPAIVAEISSHIADNWLDGWSGGMPDPETADGCPGWLEVEEISS